VGASEEGWGRGSGGGGEDKQSCPVEKAECVHLKVNHEVQ
jgi:hypothetical protein